MQTPCRSCLETPEIFSEECRELPATQRLRDQYLEVFYRWLTENDISFDEVFGKLPSAHRRDQRHSGEVWTRSFPVGEATQSLRRDAERQVQRAWDLAISWVRREPSMHHTACPFQVLLCSLAMFWGWLPVAGGLALVWGALLRSGEFLATWALLSLEEPKTRFSAARHQSAKLDWPDLVELVELAFKHLPPHAKLWSQSGQTFRTRFKDLMTGLGLIVEKSPSHRPLDLASMRPGGATPLLQTLENSETFRRRGAGCPIQRGRSTYKKSLASFT